MLNSIRDFAALVVAVWRDGVYGVDIGKILTAVAILLLFVVIRRLFSRFVLGRLRHWAGRTKSKLDDEIIDSLERPLSFVPIVAGFFFATQYLDPAGGFADFSRYFNRSLVVFTIFWGLYSSVEPFSLMLGRAGAFFSSSMLSWITKALKITFIALGSIAVLEIWGIEVAPIIAGLGLFGVAVALGAQDLFKNLIAGLFVIGERRFHPGDWILVEGTVEGTVEFIGFRTTRIRRFDRAPVYVPNSKLSDTVVTNFSKMTHRRIYWMIGLKQTTSIAQLQRIRDQIEDYVLNSPDFAGPDEVATFIRIDRITENAVDIMLYCFTKTIVWGEWLAAKEKLAYQIKAIVEANGAAFALPSRALYMEQPAPGTVAAADQPEIFPVTEDV